jgi:hypothetical protein
MANLDWPGFLHLCLFYVPPTALARLLSRGVFRLFGVRHPAPWLLGIVLIPA